ncbi:MAG: tRNA (guanosine(46)-N7)-methyltransferase TrmB [Oscillatoriales cyanobacterium SM2_2_1]|nr:tRNA (guanosine(46)-N7)-methyltransferase TrmB [Oscillatoriales cyanobacterium SM2_2_1]
MRRVRVREHVNPLGIQYQQPTPPPDWTRIYGDWKLPLSLDIGCGRGEYLLQMAQRHGDRNFLGLEIREPLVQSANTARDILGLPNLHYLFCNVNPTLPGLLPPRSIHQVTIQFPDPWFKRRQQKRRTVQPELVATLAQLLIPGGEVRLQSDVKPVAIAMIRCFDADGRFLNLAGSGQFAPDDLYPQHIPTERERWTLHNGSPIYRGYFNRRLDA